MTTSSSQQSPDLLVTGEEMAQRIHEAWRHGTLLLPLRDDEHPVQLPGLHKSVLPSGVSGEIDVELMGVGESFAAWRVSPADRQPLMIRIPWRNTDAYARSMAPEMAALTHVPGGIGPDPIAFHDDGEHSPLGAPYVATSHLPGHALGPEQWTTRHLLAHAEVLARLHQVTAAGRGPVTLGRDPWADATGGAESWIHEVDAVITGAQHEQPGLVERYGLARVLAAAHERCSAAADAFEQIGRYVLSHGDLCATNILWDGALPRYIDFEWAMADDPARDLAIIGGEVHGGPWYVPMQPQQVDAFVGAYLQSSADLGNAVPNEQALRERMRAWTAYERTSMLIHVAACATDSARHAQVLPTLRSTLAAELGVAS